MTRGEKRTVMSNAVLRRAREQAGWSREDVAARLDTSAFTIYRWEQGRARPGPYYRHKLMDLFQQSAEALGLLSTTALAEAEDADERAHIIVPPLQSLTHGFVGRNELLASLKNQMLAEPPGSLVGLYGLPGVGKTALAVELAADPMVQEHFVDGLLWVGLGPTPTVMTELHTWGRAVGLTADSLAHLKTVADLGQAVHSAIGNRRFLLVIDDAWEITDALAFKVGGPHCVTIVTTRFVPLAAQVAHTGVMRVPELTEAASIALVEHLAPGIMTHHAADMRALVQAVGGLPLALTLMGHLLQAQSLSGSTRRLQTTLRDLRSATARLQMAEPVAPTEAPPYLPAGMPLSLHAAIAVSVATLSPDARRLLSTLALFPAKPNTFSEEAAYAVTDMPAIEAFLTALDALVDAGLLESSITGRYTLHQTIADFARSNASELPVKKRFIQYFTQFVEQQHDHDPELDQDITNILWADECAEAIGADAEIIQLTLPLIPYLKKRGMYVNATHLLSGSSVAAHRMHNEDTVQQCRLALGVMAHFLGNYDQAQVVLQEGLHSSALTDAAKCHFLHTYGATLSAQGHMDEALRCFQEAKDLAECTGDQSALCEILAALGGEFLRVGRIDEAEATFQAGLTTASQLGAWEALSAHLRGLGIVAGNRAEYDKAAQYFGEGLAAARRIGYQMMIGSHLTNLGLVATNQGKIAEAKAYFFEALAVTRRIGHRASMCNILANLTHSVLWPDGYAEARTYVNEGLVIAREIGNTNALCALLFHSGHLAVRQHELALAKRDLEEGLALARQMKQTTYIIDCLEEWGEVYLLQGQKEQAAATFAEALELAKAIQHPQLIAFALYGAARAAFLYENYTDAIAWGQESLALFEEMQQHTAEDVRQWLQTLENHP